MVGELAARYVTVKYMDFLQHNQGYTSRCVCGGGGGGGEEGGASWSPLSGFCELTFQ